MEELYDKMKYVLAETFTMYFKAHGFHWNVIGPDFPQLHKLFKTIYSETWDAVDNIAEQLRSIDSFAPGTLKRILELTSVIEEDKIPTAPNMIANLIETNEIVLTCLKETYIIANELGEDGVANFLQDRIIAHKKHGWMLKATAGRKS
ncbi:MAG: ferritin-like domain-containing protein [bacterium]